MKLSRQWSVVWNDRSDFKLSKPLDRKRSEGQWITENHVDGRYTCTKHLAQVVFPISYRLHYHPLLYFMLYKAEYRCRSETLRAVLTGASCGIIGKQGGKIGAVIGKATFLANFTSNEILLLVTLIYLWESQFERNVSVEYRFQRATCLLRHKSLLFQFVMSQRSVQKGLKNTWSRHMCLNHVRDLHWHQNFQEHE